jgi:TonB family protein
MKRPFTLLFIVAMPVFAMSQKMGKFFYNKQWELTTRDSAAYVRMCVYDTLANYFVGPVVDMYLSGKPQMKGTYKATKKEGDFTFYYENGVIESTGMFENDRRIGVWKFNHPNGKPRLEAEFNNATKILALYDETGNTLISNGKGDWYEEYEEYKVSGKVIVTGKLRNYQKHGDWICKLSDGRLVYTEEYKNGEFIRGYTYPGGIRTRNGLPQGNQLILPFKFIVTEAFGASGNADFESYPFLDVLRRDGNSFYNAKNVSFTDSLGGKVAADSRTGMEIRDETSDVMPSPPDGGMAAVYRFVGGEARYPPNARRQGIQGKVYISFIVGRDGRLNSFSIVKGLSPECDEEVLRVFKKYGTQHRWNPGSQRGKPVPVRIVMPFTFKPG